MANAISGCTNCGTPWVNNANFCGSCGQPRGASTRASDPTQDAPADRFVGRSRRGIGIIAIGAGLLGAYSIGVFDDLFRSFADGLRGSPELSIEIRKGNEQGPAAKFGYVTITNLDRDSVTIKHVSVNHRTEAGCSFGPEAAVLGGKPVLATGDNIMFGTVGLLLGGCGSIFTVTVETDKGSADYKIDWR